jgi:hypothetical protein
MNLIKIGNIVLNVDRITGISDHLAPPHPVATDQPMITRVFFDQTHFDLTGADAKIFRRWYLHVARVIAPTRDEDGEDLVSPEEQVRRTFDDLLGMIDGARPRESAMRRAAHQLSTMIDHYITGELEPIRRSQFVRHLAAPHPDGLAPEASAT